MPVLNAEQAAWLESRGVVGPFRRVGGGFRTEVFESRHRNIVRIGRTPASDNTFSVEKCVMDAVRTNVAVVVPQPTIIEDRCSAFPCGVMVYPKLAGATPTAASSSLAASAASVLRQLHTMVTDFEAPDRALGLNDVAALVRLIRPCLTEAQRVAVERWMADMNSLLAANPTIRLIHGDFWQANWLTTTDGTITGLLDFERSGVGFPHEDFSPLRYLGERFRRTVLDAYCDGTGWNRESLLEETRLFDVLRELRGLSWALQNVSAREVDDALRKVSDVLDGSTN